MAKPKLKMNKTDVETAIADAFRQRFSDLQFQGGEVFSRIDPTSHVQCYIVEDFSGSKDYSFNGEAYLFQEDPKGFSTSKRYSLSGRVKVSEEDSSPVIEFTGLIGAKSK